MIAFLKIKKYDTFHIMYLLNGNDHRIVSRIKFDLNLLLLLTISIVCIIVILSIIEKKHYKLTTTILKARSYLFYSIVFSTLFFCSFNIVAYKNYFSRDSESAINMVTNNINSGLDSKFRKIPMWINDKSMVERLAKKLNITPNELRLYVVLKTLNDKNPDLGIDEELLDPDNHNHLQNDNKITKFIEIDHENIPIEDLPYLY